MIRFDKELLADVGLSRLPSNLADMTLRATYITLERRVGLRLASILTDEQFDEFEPFYENRDEEGAFAWLQSQLPDYRVVIEDESGVVRARLEAAGGWLSTVANA